MNEMEEMSPDSARDGEPATTEDINLFFRAYMRDWDEGGILCSVEKALYEHLYQNTPPQEALRSVLDRMVDIAEWVKRDGWKDLGPHDIISQKPAHLADPFIESVRPLHEAIKEGDPYAAAWAAINAAYRFALIAAQWELCVQDQEDRDAWLARSRKDAKTRARYEEIRQECDQVQAKNPRLSRLAVRQAVARRHEGEQGYSFSSIRRADQSNTNNPKKSKKPKE
jgi:hypothetical protein